MQYSVQFANNRVAEALVPPFTVEVPEHLDTVARGAEFQRLVRQRLEAALVNSPALGSMNNPADIATYTQVDADLTAQQGVVYFGTSLIGHLTLYPHP